MPLITDIQDMISERSAITETILNILTQIFIRLTRILQFIEKLNNFLNNHKVGKTGADTTNVTTANVKQIYTNHFQATN